MKMSKDEMEKWLLSEFASWELVYEYFDSYRNARPKAFGWWMTFDGASIEEFYLTNENPIGDLSGELITNRIYNEQIQKRL